MTEQLEPDMLPDEYRISEEAGNEVKYIGRAGGGWQYLVPSHSGPVLVSDDDYRRYRRYVEHDHGESVQTSPMELVLVNLGGNELFEDSLLSMEGMYGSHANGLDSYARTLSWFRNGECMNEAMLECVTFAAIQIRMIHDYASLSWIRNRSTYIRMEDLALQVIRKRSAEGGPVIRPDLEQRLIGLTPSIKEHWTADPVLIDYLLRAPENDKRQAYLSANVTNLLVRVPWPAYEREYGGTTDEAGAVFAGSIRRLLHTAIGVTPVCAYEADCITGLWLHSRPVPPVTMDDLHDAEPGSPILDEAVLGEVNRNIGTLNRWAYIASKYRDMAVMLLSARIDDEEAYESLLVKMGIGAGAGIMRSMRYCRLTSKVAGTDDVRRLAELMAESDRNSVHDETLLLKRIESRFSGVEPDYRRLDYLDFESTD